MLATITAAILALLIGYAIGSTVRQAAIDAARRQQRRADFADFYRIYRRRSRSDV